VSQTSRSAYDAWHGQHEVDRDVDTPWHRLLFTHLDGARDLAGRRVLEIACGRGGLACHLAASAHRPSCILAADFSATAVAKGRSHARQTGLSGLQWSVSDLHACAIQSETFDTVISCESIEHLERPRVACEEFARILKPGGRLYLTTPNYLGPLGLYRGYARLKGTPYSEGGQPINRFMLLPQTCVWIRRAGLRIRRVDALGHYLPWPGRPPRGLAWLDSLAPLRWFALHTLVVAEKP
jgi:2-polyprenyl-3-methyl-5-hydroxy-6-metoxy-1,4-benzoquinol methylase